MWEDLSEDLTVQVTVSGDLSNQHLTVSISITIGGAVEHVVSTAEQAADHYIFSVFETRVPLISRSLNRSNRLLSEGCIWNGVQTNCDVAVVLQLWEGREQVVVQFVWRMRANRVLVEARGRANLGAK